MNEEKNKRLPHSPDGRTARPAGAGNHAGNDARRPGGGKPGSGGKQAFGARPAGDRPRFDRPREGEGGERRPYQGEKRPYSGEKRSIGDRPRFDRPRDGEGGERRPYQGEKRPYSGEKRGFGDRPRDGEGGERRPYQGEKRPYSGEKRSFGDRPRFDRPRDGEDGERRPYQGEKRPYDGEKRSIGDRPRFDRPRDGEGGERRPYQGEKRPYSGEKRSIGDRPRSDRPRDGEGRERRPFNGEKRTFGGERSRFDRPRDGGSGDRRPFDGEKRPFSGDKRNFGGDRPRFSRPRNEEGGERRPFGGEKRSFDGEKRSFDGEKRPFGGDRLRFDRPRDGQRSVQRPADKIQRVTFRKWEGASDRPASRPFGRPAAPAARPAVPAQEENQDGIGMASRRVALQVIRKVIEEGAYASLALDEALKQTRLSPEDRRLASRLVYDTLEKQLYLDHALSQVMAREDTDIKLKNILRLGACQILLEDRIPESAATNTAVQLCRELGMEGLVGVCNGILRNLVRKKDELTFPDEKDDPIAAYVIRYSLPAWLVKRLMADWGEEEALALMGHRGGEQGVALRANTLMISDSDMEALLQTKGWAVRPGHLPHVWYANGVTDVGIDPDFLAGKFSVQAEGSMMAALSVAPRRGMQVLDACAAPGGKACLLAELMNGTGRVQAWEIHPHRTELIAAQARRMKLENIRPMTRDASKYREDLNQTMDAVLLDAPCTGLGVMAEKPDIRLRVTEESADSLVALQAQLLDALAPTVKVGGTLVYATCSVLKAENEGQIHAFLQRHPEFVFDALPDTIPSEFRVRGDQGLQLMPHREGMGGFYIARLRRTRA